MNKSMNSTKKAATTATAKGYKGQVLAELRLVFADLRDGRATDKSMAQAMTLNSNMESLGYRLKPSHVVALAKAGIESMERFWVEFQTLVPTVDAEPMYPGFPQQVMEIDEAEFRFHQLLHYMSTYGLMAFGVDVKRGWLPHDGEDIQREENSMPALIPAKVVELRDASELYTAPAFAILTKKERMSEPAKAIVAEALPHVQPEVLTGVTIPFKDNLVEVFELVMRSAMDCNRKAAVVHAVCQHTGDVWRCLRGYLPRKARYHLSTSEKRTIVRVLESFPVNDFRANLMLSSRRAEGVLKLLEFVSYNSFSRSPAHKQAVADLRAGKLRSWYSTCEYMLAGEDQQSALAFVGQRPGILLRMVRTLLKRGFAASDVQEVLCGNASQLSSRTLVAVLSAFGREALDKWTEEERKAVFKVVEAALVRKLGAINTPLRGKKIAFDPSAELYALDKSEFARSDEGGYVTAGMAFHIPEDVQKLRFFTYWNDEKCIDIDLHAQCLDVNGRAIHIGWNGNFKESDIAVFSGDITHSNAAEYIDCDLASGEIAEVTLRIHSFSRVPFKRIDTVLCGIQAVNTLGGKNPKLYTPKNCFVSQYLQSDVMELDYGYIDAKNRLLVLNASKPSGKVGDAPGRHTYNEFSIERYLNELFAAQGASLAGQDEEADVVVRVGKPQADGEVSLIDNCWFLDL